MPASPPARSHPSGHRHYRTQIPGYVAVVYPRNVPQTNLHTYICNTREDVHRPALLQNLKIPALSGAIQIFAGWSVFDV